MTKLNNPTKAVKPLTLWLKLGEDMGNDQIVLICSNLLGKIKSTQDKFEEAEAYCKRVLTLIAKKPGTGHDDLTLSTMINLTSINHKLGKHVENKQLLMDIAVMVSSAPPQRAVALVGSIAEQAFDFGYYQEALTLFQRAIELSRYSSPEEVHHYENAIAQTLAELGLISEARDKLKSLVPMLGEASPPLTVSQYLQTSDAVILEENGAVVHNVKLLPRESRVLPSTALLVCKVEHPEEGQPDLESRQMIEPDKFSNFKIPLPYARKGYYTAQIDIYSDATRSQKLSSHFVLSQSEKNINVPVHTAAITAPTETTTTTTYTQEPAYIGAAGTV